MTNAVRINRFSRIPVLACLTLVLVLLFVPAAAMGQAFVQSTSTTTSLTLAYPNPEAAGDLNVVVVGWGDTTSSVASVTDTAGNNYLTAVGTFSTGTGSNAVSQEIFYAINTKAGANSVTVGFNGNASAPDIRIAEYSGISATFPLASGGGNVGSAGSSGNASSGSITTPANSLVVGAGTTSGAFSSSASDLSNVLVSLDGNLLGDTVTGAGSKAVTDTVSGTWVLEAAAFGAAPTNLPAPTVAAGAVVPNSGPDTGGTAVVITGTNFAQGAVVSFGNISGINCAVVNSTTIDCLTPVHNSGAVDVTVTNVDGQAAVSTSAGGGGFDFTLQQPSIGSIAPTSGSTNGGTAVTVAGGNFVSGATVYFNEQQYEAQGLPAVPAGTIVVTNGGAGLTANTPALSKGSADLTVRNPDGGSTTATGIFTYTAGTGGINYVQRADAATGSSAQNVPAPMLTAQIKGNLNVVVIGWGDTNATVSGVTDSEGNTYVQALPLVQGTGLSQVIWYAANIKGDSVTPNSITVAFSRSAASPDIRVMEYSGLAATSPLDAAVGSFSSTASALADTGACAATAPGELVVAGATVANAVTGPDPNFAMVDLTTNGNGVEHRILSAAGSCEATMSLVNSENWVIQAVTFKTVTADFGLTAGAQNPTSVNPGSSASYSITVNAMNGFTGSVDLTCAVAQGDAGAGLGCSVTSPASSGSAGTLTVTTSSSTAAKTYANAVTVTGTSGNLTHPVSVNLVVAAAPSFAVTATALSPATISAGATSTSTITVAPSNGFSSDVALTCTVTSSPAAAVSPTCGFSSATVSGGNGTSTLTVTTVAAKTSARPGRGLASFYAMLLPLCGLTLLGAGFSSRKRRLLGLLLVCLMLSGVVFMTACGSGSSGGGGGGGTTTPGTTSGTYTVAVTGTAGSATQSVTPALTVTVQ